MRPRRILLAGGRLPSALELARLLAHAGHSVLLAETVSWSMTQASRAVERTFLLPSPRQDSHAYVAALCQLVEQEQVEWVIPTGEEIFWIARAQHRLPGSCKVLCDRFELLDRLHNKWELVKMAEGHGLRVPRTHLLRTREALLAVDAPERFVFKPAYSRFATRALLSPSRAALAQVEVSSEDPWLAQERLTGRQICTYSLAERGRLVAHCAYETRFTLGIGASAALAQLSHPAAQRWVETFVARERFTGQIAFDFIEHEGEPWAIECNPRATSGIHLFRETPAFAEALIQPGPGCLQPATPARSMLGVAMFLGLARLRSPRELVEWLVTFLRSKDVGFSWRDPLPALWRFVQLAGAIRVGRSLQISPQRALSHDIEWNGEPPSRAPSGALSR